MIAIVVILIVVLLFLKFKNVKEESTRAQIQQKEKEKKQRIIEPFPFDVERKSFSDLTEKQYDSLYNKFDIALERFDDAVGDVESEFTMGSFNYEARVQSLKKAIKEFDKCFEIVAPFWYEDAWFMEMLELTVPTKWVKGNALNPKNVLEVDVTPEIYNYKNINFLRWILGEYQRKEKEIVVFLKEKEFTNEN